jgi:hypothetical protein
MSLLIYPFSKKLKTGEINSQTRRSINHLVGKYLPRSFLALSAPKKRKNKGIPLQLTAFAIFFTDFSCVKRIKRFTLQLIPAKNNCKRAPFSVR